MKKGFTCKNFSKKNLGGFTLIELLIVIAIIGILTGVVLSSLNSARAKGRDAKRDSDIHQIHNALALHYDDHEKYPDSTGPTKSNNATDWGILGATLAPYIGTLPIDPLNNSSYYYTYETTDVLSNDYTLSATHERQPAVADVPASIVEFKHQYVAAKDPTGYSFTASAEVGDVVLIAVQGQYFDSTHPTARDSLGNTYTERINRRASAWTEISVLSATVTTPGTLTLYVTSTSGDLGFSAYLLRGYSSAVPNAIMSTADVTVSPDTVVISTTQNTSQFVFWGNERTSTFSSWTAGLTQSTLGNGHYDGAAYQLNVPAGDTTRGYNIGAVDTRSVMVVVAIPE